MTAPQLAERCRNALEACTWIVQDPGRITSTPAEARQSLRAALNECLSAEHWLGRLSARLDAELSELELAQLAEADMRNQKDAATLGELYAALEARAPSPRYHLNNGAAS